MSNETEIEIDASHLSEGVRNRLSAVMNQPGYTGPRIVYSMGAPRALPARPLSEEIAAWAHEAKQPAMAADAFCAEPHAADFAQFLGRLRKTSEYRASHTQADFQQRVFNVLHHIQGDSESRGLCFNVAQAAIASCGDRVALGFLDMEAACHSARIEKAIGAGHYDQKPQAVVDDCKAQYRNQVLTDAAREKIKTLNFCDEIEVALGLRVAFSREFKLNTQMDTMLYPRCSNITPQDVGEVRKKLCHQPMTEQAKGHYSHVFNDEQLGQLASYEKNPAQIAQDNQSFQKFLLNSGAMTALLARHFPHYMAALTGQVEGEIQTRSDALYRALGQLDPNNPNHEQQFKALQQQHSALRDDVTAEFKQGVLNRLCTEHGVQTDLG